MDYEKQELLDKIEKLESALLIIKDWNLPKAINRQTGKESSFELEYGSNGAKAYMRNIAIEALRS